MSAQTGVAPPSGPASERLVDRARFRVLRFEKEPNPIWIRELKQAARLGRTPIVLAVVAVLVTLLMASIGGVMATSASPAETGSMLYQVFFSLAWFVVTLVGPAVAANSIASEREGRTWEAVLLTGLRPGVVARGKFLAAYTSIAMHIVMLAPVGALPFLFGGVTATEVIVSFFFLFLIALLSVAFGLAISSKMTSLRGAILLTLLLAFPLSLGGFFSFGVGLSYLAHDAWSQVQAGPPVWLPTAYDRAPFDLSYVTFLIAMPLAAVAVPGWFLYEVTIANLTSDSDDRSTGLKRWFALSTPVLVLLAAAPLAVVDDSDRLPVAIAALSCLTVYLTFCVFLFGGEPIGPSRRVRIHWDRESAGRLRRFFGPGIIASSELLFVVGLGTMLAVTAAGFIAVDLTGAYDRETELTQLSLFATYACAFYVFVVGLGALLRARATVSFNARMMLFAILFGVAVGPWVVAAVTGIIADGSGRDALAIASPSPFFAFVMLDAADSADGATEIIAGLICSAGWVLLGIVLFLAARRRCGRIIDTHARAVAHAERLLDEEDAAAASAQSQATEEPAPAQA